MNELIKENEKLVGDWMDRIIAPARSEAPDSLYAVIVYKLRFVSIYDDEMNFEVLSDAILVLQPETLLELENMDMEVRKLAQTNNKGFYGKDFLTCMFQYQVEKQIAGLIVDAGLNVREWKNAELYLEKYRLFTSISDADDYLDELQNGYYQQVTDWQNQNPNAPHPFINGQVRNH